MKSQTSGAVMIRCFFVPFSEKSSIATFCILERDIEKFKISNLLTL